MAAHILQSPLNIRDRLSYAELEMKFNQSCEAVSESGKDLERWYNFLVKELCDVQLDRVRAQLRETELELEKCKAAHHKEIQQLKLELQECKRKSSAEIKMLKSQLQDMVTTYKDCLVEDNLAALSVLTPHTHNIVVVDTPDSSSPHDIISNYFDAEQHWSKSDHQEAAQLTATRKRGHYHTCSHHCRFARRTGSKKQKMSEEVVPNDTTPHIVVIDSLSTSSSNGRFQRRSGRIWGKRDLQNSNHPVGIEVKTNRGRTQGKLQKHQLSAPPSFLSCATRTRPFSIVVKKISRKDLMSVMSNSENKKAECITFRATQNIAQARPVRNKRKNIRANGSAERGMILEIAQMGLQQQHAGNSGSGPHGREMSPEASLRNSAGSNSMSPFLSEDIVPMRALRKNRFGVINDTMEEMPPKRSDSSNAMSPFSPEDFVPVHALRKKRNQVIDYTMEETPRVPTTSEPSLDHMCLRSRRDSLGLEKQELLKGKPGNASKNQIHRSAEQIPVKRTNRQSRAVKKSEKQPTQSSQGDSGLVELVAIRDTSTVPHKKPKRKKETTKELMGQHVSSRHADATSHATATLKTMAPPTAPPSAMEAISSSISARSMSYKKDLNKTLTSSIKGQMSFSGANTSLAQMIRKRKKTTGRRLSSTFLTDTFTDDDEVKSKKGTAIKVNTMGFVAPRLKLSQREKSFF